jgi:Uma2 family endonuclease
VSAATASFTIADLERMPEDGMHRELLHGELIEVPPPKMDHSDAVAELFASLLLYLRQRPGLGRVHAEAGYKITADGRSYLQPDVSFLSQKRWESIGPDAFALGAPDVAFEVVSPSESASTIEAKTDAYRDSGARVIVWIFPLTRTVRVTGDTEQRLHEADTLTLPDILPGWSLPVRDLFPR